MKQEETQIFRHSIEIGGELLVPFLSLTHVDRMHGDTGESLECRIGREEQLLVFVKIACMVVFGDDQWAIREPAGGDFRKIGDTGFNGALLAGDRPGA